jgi:NAD(P)-dependent dehydrogenase (short-subunit alcohol dehydrogenase family)
MRKVMLVTGAGRGIGAAVCRVAAREGFDVAVNYRASRAQAEAVVADCRAAGAKAEAIQADVGDDTQCVRLFAEVDRLFGRIDVLVNNAGVINSQARVDALPMHLLREAFAANVFSVFSCSREAIRRMSMKHGGRGGVILNLSSRAAELGGMPLDVPYAATKGALDSFTRGLMKEVGQEGIRVNAIRPGIILTDIHDSHGGEAALAKVLPTLPIGRGGTADEVAELVVFLASDKASYIHGALIDVSGGR